MVKKTNTLNEALELAESYVAMGETGKAQLLYTSLLTRFPQNKNARKGLKALQNKAAQNTQSVPQSQIDRLMAIHSSGQLNKALSEAMRLSQAHPNVPFLHNFLGSCFVGLGQLNAAAISYKRALEIKPDYAAVHNNLGLTFKKMDQLEGALACFERALEFKPDYTAALNNLGTVFCDLGRSDEAIVSFNRALDIRPEFLDVHRNLGVIYQFDGNTDAAVASFERALEIKPDCALTHYNLSGLKTYQPRDAQIELIERLLSNSKTNESDRAYLGYAMAKIYDDTGDYDKGFAFLKEANSLRKKASNYNIGNSRSYFSRIKDAFKMQRESWGVAPSYEYSAIQPVFIVGMPRSGTTLVEQILASHTKVFGAGELHTLDNFLAPVVSKSPERVDGQQYNQEFLPDIDMMRKTYLKVLTALDVSEKIITDKYPLNFMWIGFILSAFSGAKIISLKRDPRATCWSIYKHSFSNKGSGYSYDMVDLAQYYKLYVDLMSFWHEQFPHRIYDICYEDLTENQEDETRKLMEYCDLDWEEHCLNFQETKRMVKTPSAGQVRRKMYKGSSEAWKKYEPHLQPLLKSLGY